MDNGAAPMIQGAKVWLRGFREDDLEPYLRFVQTRDAQWAGYSMPASPQAVRDWYDGRILGEHGKQAYYFVVSPLGSDEFIGTTWVWNAGSRIGGFEYSIFMADPGRWGTGLGTDATNATMDYVFGFTSTTRVWLATLVSNERGQRAFAKAGFQREGVIRGYTVQRGALVDAVLMSMLRSDWEKLDRPRSWDI